MCSGSGDCCGPARASAPSCTSSCPETRSRSARRGGGAKALLPGPLLNYSVVENTLVPHFLGEHDHPWLRVLLEEHERFVGQPQRELDARLREPLPCESPPTKRKQAVHVLSGHRPSARKSVVPPARAREMVFAEAARSSTAAGRVHHGGYRSRDLARARIVLGRGFSAIGLSGGPRSSKS